MGMKVRQSAAGREVHTDYDTGLECPYYGADVLLREIYDVAVY